MDVEYKFRKPTPDEEYADVIWEVEGFGAMHLWHVSILTKIIYASMLPVQMTSPFYIRHVNRLFRQLFNEYVIIAQTLCGDSRGAAMVKLLGFKAVSKQGKIIIWLRSRDMNRCPGQQVIRED